MKVPRKNGGGGGGGRAGFRNNEWVGSGGGLEVWWFEKVVIGKWREGGGGREEEDRGLERRAVRRGGCKTQKLRFSLACSVEALFTRSECHHELAPMRAHSYVMDGGELQVERATGKTQQQLDRVWVVPSDSPRADEVLVLIDLPIDEAGNNTAQACETAPPPQ